MRLSARIGVALATVIVVAAADSPAPLVTERRRVHSDRAMALATTTAPALPRAPTRTPQRLPNGNAGWRADKAFRMNNVESLADGTMIEATPARLPTGIAMVCDHEDMRAFRAEFAMLYDAGNGGSDNSTQDGLAMTAADTESGRACRLYTQRSAMKMTTIAFRFAPAGCRLAHGEWRVTPAHRLFRAPRSMGHQRRWPGRTGTVDHRDAKPRR